MLKVDAGGAAGQDQGNRGAAHWFDALDIMLALLPDPASRRREIYRLHEWLLAHELTGIITLKSGGNEPGAVSQQPFGFMQFMVDCSVILNHSMVLGVSQRNLRVQKYRGSSFDEDESPFVIGTGGLEVAVALRNDGHIELLIRHALNGIACVGRQYFADLLPLSDK